MTDGIDLNKIPSPEVIVSLTKEEQEAVLKLDPLKEFKKGDLLVKEGQYFKESFFVIKGVVRKFRTVEGEEKTNEFYIENEAIHSPTSSHDGQQSTFSLECLEDCKINVVSFDKEKDLYKKFPRFEKLCRISTDKQLHELQEKIAIYMASSPEERYRNILDNKPDLLGRVPQYHLASYLGIKPESLSRIRKRIAQIKS